MKNFIFISFVIITVAVVSMDSRVHKLYKDIFYDKHIDTLFVMEAKEIFHVKVAVYPSLGYCIHFTNNDWKVIEEIKDSTDNTTLVFGNVFDHDASAYKNAIKLAKTLDSYQKCLDFNAKFENRRKKIEKIIY